MRISTWLVFIGFCLLPTFLWASTSREDSLLRVLNSLPNDTNKVLTYNELFKATFTSQPMKAYDYGQKALALAKELDYHFGIARLSNNLGVWHSKKGDYNASLKYYAQSRTHFLRILDTISVADCELNIGNVYYKLGDYGQAIHQYSLAMKSYQALDDTTGMLSAVNNIGSVYKEQGHYPEALQAYMGALVLRERLGDLSETALSLANVGTIYQLEGMLEPARKFFMRSLDLANQANDQFGVAAALVSIAEINLEQDDVGEALPLLHIAVSIASEIDDQYCLATASLRIAEAHQVLGQSDSASMYLKQALAINRAIGRMQGIAMALNKMGEMQLRDGHLALAEKSLLESLTISDSLEARDLSRDNHYRLSQLYGQTRDFQSAYLHQSAYLTLKDSLFSTEKSKQIVEMRTRYGAVKQQQEIDRLNLQTAQDQLRIARSSWRSLILLAILVPVLLLAIVFILRFLQKRRHNRGIEEKNAEIQMQKDLLEAQNRQIKEINISLERMVEQRTQAMRNANQELDTFLYESAHALRRPLLRIQGLEEIIEAEKEPMIRARLRGQLKITLAGMDELLHKLIYVSESGKRDLRLEPVSVHMMVAEISAQQPMAEVLISKITADQMVVTDAYLMKLLLTMVLENAFRFLDLGRPDQFVKVWMEQDEAFVTVHIQDNGTGIDAAQLTKVTEMFFRGANHRGGNGLGLYIAAKIAEKLHGSLSIESAIGVGTTVSINLPLHFV